MNEITHFQIRTTHIKMEIFLISDSTALLRIKKNEYVAKSKMDTLQKKIHQKKTEVFSKEYDCFVITESGNT